MSIQNNNASEKTRTWRIPVSWEMSGMVTVEAATLEEAMYIARDDAGVLPLPDLTNSDYVDGSWRLSEDNLEFVRECYNGNQADISENQVLSADRIWSEIQATFFDEEERCVCVDAWLTDDEWEEGKVVAKVFVDTKTVFYLDARARYNCYAQEVVQAAMIDIESGRYQSMTAEIGKPVVEIIGEATERSAENGLREVAKEDVVKE